MAVHHHPGKALVLRVEVYQIIVLRGGAHADLGTQIEGVEKAVHEHHQQRKHDGRDQYGCHADGSSHQHQRKAALHISLIHLACARDKGEQQGQDAIFLHNRSLISQYSGHCPQSYRSHP